MPITAHFRGTDCSTNPAEPEVVHWCDVTVTDEGWEHLSGAYGLCLCDGADDTLLDVDGRSLVLSRGRHRGIMDAVRMVTPRAGPGTDIAKSLYDDGQTNDTLAHCDVQSAIPATSCASVQQVRLELARLCGEDLTVMDGSYEQVAERCPFCQCKDIAYTGAHRSEHGTVWLTVWCPNCERRWDEEYRFEGLVVEAQP